MPTSSESRTDIDVTLGRRQTRGRRPMRSSGKAAVTTETILDLVDRLGLIDLVVSRVRTRLEDVDFDEMLDELGDYFRRNPEVLVVALATITVSAGLRANRRQTERGSEAEQRSFGAGFRDGSIRVVGCRFRNAGGYGDEAGDCARDQAL